MPAIALTRLPLTAFADRAPSSSPIHTADPSITTANIIRLGHLPQPGLGNIGEIDKAIKALARTQAIKERLCEYIQREVSHTLALQSSLAHVLFVFKDYIKGLIDVMGQAEDLESIENLHALCLLMQTIRECGVPLPSTTIQPVPFQSC